MLEVQVAAKVEKLIFLSFLRACVRVLVHALTHVYSVADLLPVAIPVEVFGKKTAVHLVSMVTASKLTRPLSMPSVRFAWILMTRVHQLRYVFFCFQNESLLTISSQFLPHLAICKC